MNNETVSEEDMQVELVIQVLAGQLAEGVIVNVFFQTIPGNATGKYIVKVWEFSPCVKSAIAVY